MKKECDAEEKILVDLLRENGQMDIDTLTLRSNLSMSKVASNLLNLEFAGLLRSLPGRVYMLN